MTNYSYSSNIISSLLTCTLIRDVGGGLLEMSATIPIQATLLKDASSIPYKYGVLNCKSDNIKSHFEYLHGAPGRGENVNRCLIIPTPLFQSGGMWMRYMYMYFY